MKTCNMDLDKKVRIVRQLCLLLHAMLCENGCQQTGCSIAKNILSHVKHCKDGNGCSVRHCKSSLQMLIHWKVCGGCPVCLLVRRTGIRHSAYHLIPNHFLHYNNPLEHLVGNHIRVLINKRITHKNLLNKILLKKCRSSNKYRRSDPRL